VKEFIGFGGDEPDVGSQGLGGKTEFDELKDMSEAEFAKICG
jgi:hypothetical protein